MRRVCLDMAVEVDEVVDCAYHNDRHDDDPHGMDDITLDGSVHEDAVSDQVVVVEVSSDDRWAEVDDDATDVDHQDSEEDAAQAPPCVAAEVALAEGVRLAADHRDDVEPGCCYDDDVGPAEGRTVGRRDVLEQAVGERNAVEALDQVEDTGVHEEGARHPT